MGTVAAIVIVEAHANSLAGRPAAAVPRSEIASA
jgi:hypothetical protein